MTRGTVSKKTFDLSSFVVWMVATRRIDTAERAWAMLMEAHAQAMSYGRSKTAASEYLDRLMRTARAWGVANVPMFLDIEINQRRMTKEQALLRCGWRKDT